MAAGFMQNKAGERVQVLSAGSAPKESINPIAVQVMAEVGIDISSSHPKILTDSAVQESDVVITMGCGDACPMVKATHRVDWVIPDPRDMDEAEFRTVRDLIGAKVKKLIEEG